MTDITMPAVANDDPSPMLTKADIDELIQRLATRIPRLRNDFCGTVGLDGCLWIIRISPFNALVNSPHGLVRRRDLIDSVRGYYADIYGRSDEAKVTLRVVCIASFQKSSLEDRMVVELDQPPGSRRLSQLALHVKRNGPLEIKSIEVSK